MTVATTPEKPISDLEKHRRAQFYARVTYATIIVAFVSICATAVIFTMQSESHKEGFQAIEVAKPISFFDYTYVKKK